MSNMTKHIATAVTGHEFEKSWSDILDALDGTATPEKQTETEQEVKYVWQIHIKKDGVTTMRSSNIVLCICTN